MVDWMILWINGSEKVHTDNGDSNYKGCYSLYSKMSFEMTNMEKGAHRLKMTEDQQPDTTVAFDLVSCTILQDT